MAQGRPLIENIVSYDTLNDPADTQYAVWVGGSSASSFPGATVGVGAAAGFTAPAGINFTPAYSHGRDLSFTRTVNTLVFNFNEGGNIEWENTTGSSKTVTHFLITVDSDSTLTDPLLIFPLVTLNVTVPDGAKIRITNIQFTLLNSAG